MSNIDAGTRGLAAQLLSTLDRDLPRLERIDAYAQREAGARLDGAQTPQQFEVAVVDIKARNAELEQQITRERVARHYGLPARRPWRRACMVPPRRNWGPTPRHSRGTWHRPTQLCSAAAWTGQRH